MRLPFLIAALTIVGPCYTFTVTRDSLDPSFSWRGRSPQTTVMPLTAEWARETVARLSENRKKERLLATNLPLKMRIAMCLNRSHPVIPAFNISSFSSWTSSSSTSMPDTARRQFIIDIIDEAYSQPPEQDQEGRCPIEYKLFGDLALRLWRSEPSDFISFEKIISPLFKCLETRRPFGLELFQLMRSIEGGDVTSVDECYPDRSANSFPFGSSPRLPFISSSRRGDLPRMPRIQLDVTKEKTPAENIPASTRRIGVKSAPIGNNMEAFAESLGLLDDPVSNLGDGLLDDPVSNLGDTFQDDDPQDQTGRSRNVRTTSSGGQSVALKNIMKLLTNKKGKLVGLPFKQKLKAHRAKDMNVRNNKLNEGKALADSRFKNLWRKLSDIRLNKDKGRRGLDLPRKQRERGEKGRITRRERDFLLELISAMRVNGDAPDGTLMCTKQCRRLIAERLRLAPRVRDEHD
ncbi:uncharacterized protein LOC135491098 [Lineus longissimus]|uniref:uncharacterized protein LOC135491098 n=1 Tax=Lineus longissimus TaxID=88925 RepID=UPI002B4CBC5C